MKKIILLAIIFLSLNAIGQNLVVTPSGLRADNDTTKEFVVVEAPGKTAAELYENVYNYIQKTYKDPVLAIKGKVPGEYIHFGSNADKVVLGKSGLTKHMYDLTYITQLEFKDGKAKLTFQNFEFLPDSPSNKYKFNIQGGTFDGYVIYNNKGELKNEGAKLQLEEFFKARVDEIKAVLSGTHNVNVKKEEW